MKIIAFFLTDINEAKNCIFNIKKVKPCSLEFYIQSPTLIEKSGHLKLTWKRSFDFKVSRKREGKKFLKTRKQIDN